MTHKNKNYNRRVCTFCPTRSVCDGLRGAIHCGDCKYTIPCTQTEGPGLADCKRAKEVWAAATLPRTCMLGAQVLVNPPDDATLGMMKEWKGSVSEHSSMKDAGETVLIECPRCSCKTSMVTTRYEWVPGKKMRTHREMQCSVCSLDVAETFK